MPVEGGNNWAIRKSAACETQAALVYPSGTRDWCRMDRTVDSCSVGI